MGEAFAGSGEVFVDRFEMIFQRRVNLRSPLGFTGTVAV
jgi:hypothetical protein